MAWKVQDVMTSEVATVMEDTPFKTCVDLLRIHSITALPVVDAEGHITGIVSEADLLLKEEKPVTGDSLRRETLAAAGRTAGDVMARGVVCCGPSTSLSQAARLMHRRGVKRLPVVDTLGSLVGIVSRSDLLRVFLRSDESLRREISEGILKETLAIPAGKVEVSVCDGTVTLTGTLESDELVGLVERLTQNVEGVVSVDNRLHVATPEVRSLLAGEPARRA